MVRHIARALVQQAEGEDQCDSLPAQCSRRDTLTGSFRV